MRELTPEPLTAEAFAPFGSVIEASDAAVKLDINQGHAVRYDRLAEIDVADEGGAGVISLFRAKPLAELVLKTFERHPLGSQSFVPLSGRPYLVAVAPAGDFDPAANPPVPRRGPPGRPLSKGHLAPFPARPRRERFPRHRPRRPRRQLRGNPIGPARPNSRPPLGARREALLAARGRRYPDWAGRLPGAVRLVAEARAGPAAASDRADGFRAELP